MTIEYQLEIIFEELERKPKPLVFKKKAKVRKPKKDVLLYTCDVWVPTDTLIVLV